MALTTFAVHDPVASIKDADDLRHGNPLWVLPEHIPPTRPADAADKPLFLETMKELFQVGDGKVLSFGNEGGGDRTAARGERKLNKCSHAVCGPGGQFHVLCLDLPTVRNLTTPPPTSLRYLTKTVKITKRRRHR
jgi:hypothetical protein